MCTKYPAERHYGRVETSRYSDAVGGGGKQISAPLLQALISSRFSVLSHTAALFVTVGSRVCLTVCRFQSVDVTLEQGSQSASAAI